VTALGVWELVGLVGFVLATCSAVACVGLIVICALGLVRDRRVERRARRLRELGESERRRARSGEALARSAGRPYGCGVRPEPGDASEVVDLEAARVRRRNGGGWAV
jgi:hypothetical protein